MFLKREQDICLLKIGIAILQIRPGLDFTLFYPISFEYKQYLDLVDLQKIN